MISVDQVKSEKALRELIERNLRKEIHPGTKSSVDFIHKILEDAYSSDLVYDVTDLRNRILAFANGSTNQSLQAIKVVQSMKFASEVSEEKYDEVAKEEAPIVFYDVEVFPNLFVVCWKYIDSPTVTTWINPTASDMEQLMRFRLIGFNNRGYDNHIIYARYLGYDLARLYKLSQRLINNDNTAKFGEAYNLSYQDIYDFANIKMSLKKWEIELDLLHLELGLPWDQPVPEELWQKVADYCANDVLSTEEVFKNRKQDFIARQILSELSGLSVNSTTQQHAARIIFGENRRPQEHFVYTKLQEKFPGYEFKLGKSSYRGEDPSEGGYVYSEPGMYENVVLLDVTSMHPTSIEQLELFGPYTEKFSDLKRARVAIKRKDFDEARTMFNGIMAKYLEDESNTDALSYALKIVINIVYGLTSAKFDNAFRDPRNIDNIVAKRGALFMINVKHLVQELGYQVIHIKTDSIKIVVPKHEKAKTIIDAVMEYAEQYGYEFEHEATYEKICLVNNAVFVGKKTNGREPAQWTATGAQFQHPYVFKKLFLHEPIGFKDLCEPKSVQRGSLWLDFTAVSDQAMALAAEGRRFVGRTGNFCPVTEGGGVLLRVGDDGKESAAAGSSGHQWLEADMVKTLKLEDKIDMGYFDKLVDEAKDNISKYGDFEWFVS